MHPFWKYLISIGGLFFVFYLYLNINRVYKTEGIDVIEVSDNIKISQQKHSFPKHDSQHHSKKQICSRRKHNQKGHDVKYVSIEAIIHPLESVSLFASNCANATSLYRNNYYQLFFKEINPPPPWFG